MLVQKEEELERLKGRTPTQSKVGGGFSEMDPDWQSTHSNSSMVSTERDKMKD